jgi:hypothetical protein
MARQSIPVTVCTHAGVAYPSPTADIPADDAEIEDNDGRIILIMENVSGSTRIVTIQTGAGLGDPPIPLQDQAITLLTTAKKVAGPFSTTLFNQTGDGGTRSVLVDIDGGSNGDVTFVALQVPLAVS